MTTVDEARESLERIVPDMSPDFWVEWDVCVQRLIATVRAEREGLVAVAERLQSIAEAVYGGAERPADDAGLLMSLADWMDRIDDAMDQWIASTGRADRVGRGMQEDLRRIAAAIPTPETVARALFRRDCPGIDWATLPPSSQRRYLEDGRVLHAALLEELGS